MHGPGHLWGAGIYLIQEINSNDDPFSALYAARPSGPPPRSAESQAAIRNDMRGADPNRVCASPARRNPTAS